YGVEFGMHFLSVIADRGSVYAYHNFPDGGESSIGLATTTDGIAFTNRGKVVARSASGWDSRFASFPGAAKVADDWFLVFEGAGDSPGDIGLAASGDGLKFAKRADPILVHAKRQAKDTANLSLAWEQTNIGTPSLYYEKGRFFLFYHGFGKNAQGGPDDCQLGLASGADLTSVKRVGNGPILRTSQNGWDAGTVGKRSILKQGDYYYMAYEGSTDQPYDKAKWSSGLARSKAIAGPWQKFKANPILPTTDKGFGYDGPEFLQLGDILYIYFRSPAGPTSRAALVWK
ncbi:MAG TPA: hypothetical protein VGH74_15215, partial [Planctomycetaceae bacterium]